MITALGVERNIDMGATAIAHIGMEVQRYMLWEGEMCASVYIDIGAHGFYSAAMVIQRCDDPIETRAFDGYKFAAKGKDATFEWIAAQLNELASPKKLALELGVPNSDIVLIR